MVVRELLIALGFDFNDGKAKAADQRVESLKAKGEAAAGVFLRLATILGVVFSAHEVVKMADVWTNVNSRIGLVTQNLAEQADIQQKVFDIAQRTRQEYEGTGALYFKMALFSKELKASQQDVLDVTETVNKALVVGGASKQEANSTILQLSQALASGFLQGDELRALRENAPLLMAEMAKYLGTTIGGLKEMGAQGELTSEKVFKAILHAKAAMDAKFGQMPVTVEQGVTKAMNSIGNLIGKINKETGIFQTIAKGIADSAEGIANSIERAAKKVGGFASAIKLAAISIVSFGIAILGARFIMKEGLVTMEMWSLGLKVLRLYAIQGAQAIMTLASRFLMFTGIAAALATLALTLEDIYYWATGGESILGDMIGDYSEWEKTLEPIASTVNQIKKALDEAAPSIDLVKWAVNGLCQAIMMTLQPLILLLKLIRGWQSIGGFAGITDISGGPDIGPSWGVSPVALARSGVGGPVTITQKVEVSQANSVNSQTAANEIGTATAGATIDAMERFTRDLQFALP